MSTVKPLKTKNTDYIKKLSCTLFFALQPFSSSPGHLRDNGRGNHSHIIRTYCKLSLGLRADLI